MDILYWLATLFFIISVIKRILYSAEIIYLSKYKFNLLIPSLKEKQIGKYQKYLISFKLIGLILYLPASLNDNLLNYYHLVILFIFIFDSIPFIFNYKNHKTSFISTREYFIGAGTILVISLLYFNALADRYFWILLLERISLGVYFFFSFIFSFPYELIEDMHLNKLKLYQGDLKNELVVIIYGENSNKTGDILQQLLNKIKFKQIKRDSINSIMQLARILRRNEFNNSGIRILDLQTTTEDFIKIMENIKPQICILNSLPQKNNHTVSRYLIEESLKNIQKAGLLILNNDNLKPRQRIFRYITQKSGNKKKIAICSMEPAMKSIEPDHNIFWYSCSNLISDGQDKHFIMSYNANSYYINSALIDKSYMNTIAPALVVLRFMNYSFKEIVRTAAKI